MRQGATYLYRLYDKLDRLLYIGVSQEPNRRVYQHQCTSSPLFDMGFQIDRWTCWRYPDRDAAEEAELDAIWNEDPLYNTHGRREGLLTGERLPGRWDVSESALAEFREARSNVAPVRTLRK